MTFFQRPASNTPFSTEHACVTYLFQKRWPWGFKCPFCTRVQKDIAPAYTVVCRYCRKQTSITARTLMHGSKKNLVAWQPAELLRQYLVASGMVQPIHTMVDFYTHIKGIEYIICVMFFVAFPVFFRYVEKRKTHVRR